MNNIKYKSKNELIFSYIMGIIVMIGMFYAFHYYITETLNSSLAASLSFIVPAIFIIIPKLLAKYQVDFRNQFGTKKIEMTSIEKKLAVVSITKLHVFLLFVVMIELAGFIFGIVKIFIKDDFILGSFLCIIGLTASAIIFQISKSTYNKK